MPGIDPTLTFLPLNIAVLTVLDTRDAATDSSGALLVQRATAAGHVMAGKALVPDDVAAIPAVLRDWIARPDVDVILSTGGTGFSLPPGQPDHSGAVDAVGDTLNFALFGG